MDWSAIQQAIGVLGFPIVCSIALFWKMNQQDKVHKEELDSIRTALDNNTVVLTQLVERLGGNK